MNKNTFKKFLKKIPKPEIHLHSEAVLTKKTAFELLSREDSTYKNIKDIEKLFSYKDLTGFVNTFLKIQSSFHTLSDFTKLFNDLTNYLKRNNIVYAEVFFSPSLFNNNGLDVKNILELFIKNIKKTKNKYNITIKILIDVSRTFGIENALKIFNKVALLDRKNIIGIGLGGDEKRGPAKDFVDVFKLAKQHNMHRVAHAGESVESQSIWDTIKLLDIERIGHGLTAIDDKKLLKYLIKKQIPLEVCPSSNVCLNYVDKIKNHPIKIFYKKGLNVTLNTDDPIFFGVELIDEYWNLYSKLNFKLSDIKQIIINGFNATFLSKKLKIKYIKKVKKKWKKYKSLYR